MKSSHVREEKATDINEMSINMMTEEMSGKHSIVWRWKMSIQYKMRKYENYVNWEFNARGWNNESKYEFFTHEESLKYIAKKIRRREEN